MYPMAAAKGMDNSDDNKIFMKKLLDESDKIFGIGKEDFDS